MLQSKLLIWKDRRILPEWIRNLRTKATSSVKEIRRSSVTAVEKAERKNYAPVDERFYCHLPKICGHFTQWHKLHIFLNTFLNSERGDEEECIRKDVQLVSLCEMTLDLGEVAIESFVNRCVNFTLRFFHCTINKSGQEQQTYLAKNVWC